jgi:Mrp family chromosome partitioning ATPase
MTSTSAGRGRAPGVVRTFFWPILAVAVLTSLAAARVVYMQPPVYESTGSVLVNPDRQGGAPVLPQMGTERAVAESAEVAELAAETLDVTPAEASAQLEATVPVDANVVDLTYTASNAEDAFAGAEAFTEAYVDYRNLDLRRPIAQVITEPEKADAPNPPNYAVTVVLALIAGLALGFVLAFVWDRLRGRLRGPSDAARATAAEVLASVPARAKVDAPLRTGVGELGHLAARLSTLVGDRRRRVSVMVTAPRRGAGATTVAVHLAVALADIGREVVLVSGNVRRPDLHRVLGLQRAPGLAEVLHGKCDLTEAVQYTSKPNLRVLTAGSSAGMTHVDVDDYLAVVARLSSSAIVVIDAAPVLEVPETVLVGDAADLTVLVVDVRSGSRADAAAAADTLRELRTPLTGVVANRPRASRRIEEGPASGGQSPGTDPRVPPAEKAPTAQPVTRTGAAETTHPTVRTGADRDAAAKPSS